MVNEKRVGIYPMLFELLYVVFIAIGDDNSIGGQCELLVLREWDSFNLIQAQSAICEYTCWPPYSISLYAFSIDAHDHRANP